MKATALHGLPAEYEYPIQKRQRAAARLPIGGQALHNLAEARRALETRGASWSAVPPHRFVVRPIAQEHVIVTERSHPSQSGGGPPHSKTWRNHDGPSKRMPALGWTG